MFSGVCRNVAMSHSGDGNCGLIGRCGSILDGSSSIIDIHLNFMDQCMFFNNIA